MKKLVPILLALAVTAALAATAYAATKTVRVGDNYFVRSGGATVTVTKNTTVIWKNVGRSAHTVTVTRGPVKFNKAPLRSGSSYSRKMTTRGTYKLVCRYHSGQRMTLVVK